MTAPASSRWALSTAPLVLAGLLAFAKQDFFMHTEILVRRLPVCFSLALQGVECTGQQSAAAGSAADERKRVFRVGAATSSMTPVPGAVVGGGFPPNLVSTRAPAPTAFS